MAVNPRQHIVTVSNNDNGAAKLGVRWSCSCGRVGKWTWDKLAAARRGQAHAVRFTKGS